MEAFLTNTERRKPITTAIEPEARAAIDRVAAERRMSPANVARILLERGQGS
jgi:hypothetical protein